MILTKSLHSNEAPKTVDVCNDFSLLYELHMPGCIRGRKLVTAHQQTVSENQWVMRASLHFNQRKALFENSIGSMHPITPHLQTFFDVLYR